MSAAIDETAIARGRRAEAILEDPLVAEAFAAIERECVEEWRAAPARDVEGRERLWLMLKLAERLRRHFESLVHGGKLAGERMAQLDRERRFRFIR
ncbi:MAG: hypothetical protein JO010_08130 [Alphaproteobacteria bacterium]|nr:hypothetical protein [Alphaproteobacteria bacterium]